MPTLDKQQSKVTKILEYFPPTHTLPPKMARPIFTVVDRLVGIKKASVKAIKNIKIKTLDDTQTIPVRIYYPSQPNTKNPSAMMYFHGGGCVIGSIASHDRLCRHLAQHSGTVIISVGYRLAPEHKFPTPIIDAIHAWNWLQENKKALELTNHQIGVGGDSAGAYLAVLTELQHVQKTLSVQASVKPDFQYLLYPMMDLRGGTESYKNAQGGMLLTNQLMDYFTKHYLENPEQTQLPLASLLLINDFSELSKTYLLTLEFDPLKDSGIAFANALTEQGVNVTHEHFDDCMHSFVSTAKVSQRAKQGVDQITQQLKDLCST